MGKGIVLLVLLYQETLEFDMSHNVSFATYSKMIVEGRDLSKFIIFN